MIRSQGYTFKYAPAMGERYAVGFAVVGPTWRYNGKSAAVAANSCGAITTLTADDNEPFDMVSIDLAELNGKADVEVVVEFTGVTENGKEVSQSVRLDGPTGWQTVQFAATFHKLRSLSWVQGNCTTNFPHMFDNVNAIPTWKGKQQEKFNATPAAD